MFRRLPEAGAAALRVRFEDRTLPAAEGDSVAAALLAAGVVGFRTSPASGAERGPHCLMGVCFDCLVEIDGMPNRRACQEPVRDGMRVRRQAGARKPP